jgi:hypothetical protein
MNEPTPETVPAPRRRRWRAGVLVALLLFAAAVASLGVLYLSDRGLPEALAEADRLDPGWRFENLEGARAPVPDAENGAALVLAARARIPPAWLNPPQGGAPGLEDRLADLPPPQRPGEAERQELRAEMAKVAGAIDVARGLADRPRGRYAVAWSKDLIGTPIPHVQQPREVARLLAHDALLRALDGDGEGAVRSCRAALNAGRSLSDEPCMVSQIVRVACGRLALRALEQTLAQGEAPAPALEDLQRLLEAEAEEPLQLVALRAERVGFYECLQAMRTGRFNRAAYGLAPSALGPTADGLYERVQAQACAAAYLRYFNELVEIAKLPSEQQQERLKGLREPSQKLPVLLEALTRGSNWPKLAQSFHDARAELRCAAAALAAERYRLAEGRWPEGLDALVPRYLAAVPADPFDGRPLRLKRLPEGVVLYSIGPDGTDDGGVVDHKRPQAPGTDVEFRLWDAGRRGQLPPQE